MWKLPRVCFLGGADQCPLYSLLPSSPPWQRFSHSMKLDNELGRLTVEHGTMRGPPTEQERVAESSRKQLAHRVGPAGSRALWPSGLLVAVCECAESFLLLSTEQPGQGCGAGLPWHLRWVWCSLGRAQTFLWEGAQLLTKRLRPAALSRARRLLAGHLWL